MRKSIAVVYLVLVCAMVLPSVAGAQVVVVGVRPPAPRVEIQTPRPSADDAWVGGYWQWNGSQHVWVAGNWQRPQQPGASWQEPRWMQTGAGWRFEPGAWVARDPGAVVVNTPPPPPRMEQQGPPPGPGMVWVGGYWQWTGRSHEWVAGRWEAPAQPDMRWDAPRWEHRGNGWGFVEGRWAPGEHEQVAPPPQQPVYDDVPRGPPPQRFEHRGRPPEAGQAWVGGYWQWNGRQHDWTPGHWEAPQQPGATWRSGRWARHGRSWSYRQGDWVDHQDHGHGHH